MDMQAHWDKMYNATPDKKLGWFESRPEKSLELIEHCGLASTEKIIDIGSGASVLLDILLAKGFTNLTALDISPKALEVSRRRLGHQADKIHWLIEDLSHPTELLKIRDVALWHDRAVLHFLREEKQRQAYHKAMLTVIRPGGHVIIAAFARGGATKCSGLDVYNYNREMLIDFMGHNFKIQESFNYIYHMPAGDERLYIYARFLRNTNNY